MKLNKILIAAALATTLVAPAAHAGVISSADLAITSLLVVSGGAPVTSGLTIVSESRTGSAASNYNGVEGTGVGMGSKTGFGSGAVVDVNYRCAGPDCGAVAAGTVYAGSAENNSGYHLPNTPTHNFSLGDMFIAGSALGGGGGANGLTRADTSVANGSNSGGSNATILNSATVSTVLLATETLTAQFALSYDAFVAAIVQALAPGETGVAAAAIGWTLNLSSTDDAAFLPLTWSPSELNVGFTSTNASQNQQTGVGSIIGSILSESRTLTQGRTYLLTINQASNATAQFVVPEPGSLLLVGLGLFALAMVKRRQQH